MFKSSGIIISIVTFVLLSAACSSLQEPQIRRIDNITFKGLTGDGLNLNAKLSVYNPNNKNIKIYQADLDVYLDDSKIGKLTIDQLNVLEAKKESPCLVSVVIDQSAKNKVNLKTIGKIIHKEIPIRFKGNIQVQSGLFKRTFLLDGIIDKQ